MKRVVLDGISKSFARGGGAKAKVFDSLSLELGDDEFTSLIGPNGSGKTTLLNIIASVTRPDSGTVEIRTQHRGAPHIGFVWQDYRASLLPWYSVAENIAFPLRISGQGRQERKKRAESLLRMFTGDVRAEQRISELSGGQQQLVNVLRSFIDDPDVLLMDEPFSALDQQRRWTLALYVQKAWLAAPKPVLFVSHDIDEGVLLADKILLLSARQGKIQRTLHNPLPRPRTIAMLTAAEHLACRKAVIEFLADEGLVQGKD